MMLYIDGTDIAHLVLGEVACKDANWRLCRVDDIAVGPEGYLAAIAAFLGGSEVAGVIAVQGPGSPTALRGSLSIANAFQVANGIPLYGVQAGVREGILPGSSSVLLAEYTDAPRITTPTHDALRRQK